MLHIQEICRKNHCGDSLLSKKRFIAGAYKRETGEVIVTVESAWRTHIVIRRSRVIPDSFERHRNKDNETPVLLSNAVQVFENWDLGNKTYIIRTTNEFVNSMASCQRSLRRTTHDLYDLPNLPAYSK